jgi:FMN phosphatase YigB (HAD superfamily)
MVDTFLFDWGDTLMIDFPDAQGKMRDWEVVEAVEGAELALSHISKTAKIYIATGTADSNEVDIEKAFERVGLSKYISGYFSKANVGFGKGTSEFYQSILSILDKEPSQVTMVGDNFQNDITPAANIGIQTFWLTSSPATTLPKGTITISRLNQLCA